MTVSCRGAVEIVDAPARLVDHEQRVYPDVTFRVPFGLLRAIDERFQLGKEPVDDPELERQREAERGTIGKEEQFLDLAPDTLGRQIVERDGAADRFRVRIHLELEAGGELNAAEDAQAVVSEGPRIDSAQYALLEQVAPAAERIEIGVGEWIPRDRIHREIPAARRLVGRHVGIAADFERPMAAADLRFPPRQRHVDVEDLVDGEALADGVDGGEGGEQRLQARCGEPVDLEIDILPRPAEQPVAHPAPDHERPAAVLVDEARDSRRGLDAHRARVRVGSAGAGATTRRRPYLRISRSVNAGAIALRIGRPREARCG